MIKKEDFIKRFLDIIKQELEGKLPASGTLDELYDVARLILERRFKL